MKSLLDVIKAENPILEIQFNLRDIAQNNSEIPMIIPSGTCDSQTLNAVKEFQRIFDLPITGKVDYATWKTLIIEHKNSAYNINMPSNVCCFPANSKEYKKGDNDNVIYILQIILKNYHNKYKNYADVQLTGIFDEQTETALKQFQKCSNLPVTGILDRQSWNTLNKINETCKLYE
ncbi:MAG: peptidoglycan-binding protein [Sedimentibacter sp.]